MKHPGTYSTWSGMKQRCFNPRNAQFKNYGGRGITICARWMDFDCFLADMGERPAGLTIERIDNDGHYEPSNCKWATQAEQRRNKRSCHYVEFRGERMLLRDVARRSGICEQTILRRIAKQGWTLERAATEPPNPYRSKAARIGLRNRYALASES